MFYFSSFLFDSLLPLCLLAVLFVFPLKEKKIILIKAISEYPNMFGSVNKPFKLGQIYPSASLNTKITTTATKIEEKKNHTF